MISIRKASLADLPELMELFGQARLIMRSDGNMNQWTGGYPQAGLVEGDIARGDCYVCMDENKRAVGTFAFIVGEDPTYAKIYEGSWMDDTRPYGTIHRLASLPDVHGVAAACIDWCYSRLPNLRADTHRDNRIMRHVLQRNGFVCCGIIYLMNGDERLAYQKCAAHAVPSPSATGG